MPCVTTKTLSRFSAGSAASMPALMAMALGPYCQATQYLMWTTFLPSAAAPIERRYDFGEM